MFSLKFAVTALLACTLLSSIVPAYAAPAERPKVEGLQHTGAVHFYAQPGTLEVGVWKRDSAGNTSDRTITAVLAGPDGTIHDRLKLVSPLEQRGKAGEVIEGNLKAQVSRPGIYTLLVSSNQDSYMRAQTFGFSTNATQYMINAATAHTDVAREETIMLNGEDKPFGIFFKPPRSTFKVDLKRLLPTATAVEIYDAAGALVHTIPVKEGNAATTIAAGEGARNGIWELRLPHQKGNILIEGLNHAWIKGERPLPVWTTSRESYFDLADYHWLLQPRRFARLVKAGDKGTFNVTVHNNSASPMPVELSVDAPAALGKIRLVPEKLEVAPGANRKVQLQYDLSASLPNGRHDLYVTAKDTRNQRQAFSLFQFRAGEAATDTVNLPIELKLYEHDQFQFAYEPDYPRTNQFYFDSNNRPWQITNSGLQVLAEGEWKTIQLPGADQTATYAIHALGTDNNGFVYGIVNRNGKPYLMRAESKTRLAELVELPAGGYYTPEMFTGGKTSAYPPVVLRYVVDTSKAQVAFWSRVHRLEMFLTEIKDGKLQIGAPILISDNCVGMSAHSGITNPVATDGDKLHLIWGETSDPAKKDPGVPTYTSTYDRKTGALTKPVFLAYSPPVNDVHNMSTLIIDSKGDRHVIIGSHGQPFQYLYSPNGSEEWTKPKEVTNTSPTYIGAVFDKTDNIHLFFRQWRRQDEYTGAELGYQQMESGGTWKEQKPFAISALPAYSVFYHRLTVDRIGRLYLSFDYWSTWGPYRESYPDAARRRLMFTSGDSGKTWHVVTTPQMTNGIFKQ